MNYQHVTTTDRINDNIYELVVYYLIKDNKLMIQKKVNAVNMREGLFRLKNSVEENLFYTDAEQKLGISKILKKFMISDLDRAIFVGKVRRNLEIIQEFLNDTSYNESIEKDIEDKFVGNIVRLMFVNYKAKENE